MYNFLFLSYFVVICSKYITFAVTKTTSEYKQLMDSLLWLAQNSLPLRWQRQHDMAAQTSNVVVICSKFITFAVTKTTVGNFFYFCMQLWFAQNSLPLRWQRQPRPRARWRYTVVICSKFITFAVTKTTFRHKAAYCYQLWFAQNSLPLRWQRQQLATWLCLTGSCDLLKIHYLCGDKDNA